MAEGPWTSEITSFDQINHTIFKELLTKSSAWDFYEMSREEYMNKNNNEKKKALIIQFYKYMVQGKILLFVSSLMSGFCVSDIELVCVVSTFSSMMRFSPVVSSVSSSAYKLCFVFDALLVYESSSESE